MSFYLTPQDQLLTRPDRQTLLDLVENYLMPSVERRKLRDERDARRPLTFDPVECLQNIVRWGRTAPLDRLWAVVHWHLWTWMMTMDDELKSMILQSQHDEWWGEVCGMIKAWQSAERVDWPSDPLHPTPQRYEPRCCSCTALVSLLEKRFQLSL